MGFSTRKGSHKTSRVRHVGRFHDAWMFDQDKWQCVASHTSLPRTKYRQITPFVYRPIKSFYAANLRRDTPAVI